MSRLCNLTLVGKRYLCAVRVAFYIIRIGKGAVIEIKSYIIRLGRPLRVIRLCAYRVTRNRLNGITVTLSPVHCASAYQPPNV